jgi:hypothetical protein
MSGLDEQEVLFYDCPVCTKNVGCWTIKGSSDSRRHERMGWLNKKNNMNSFVNRRTNMRKLNREQYIDIITQFECPACRLVVDVNHTAWERMIRFVKERFHMGIKQRRE